MTYCFEPAVATLHDGALQDANISFPWEASGVQRQTQTVSPTGCALGQIPLGKMGRDQM